MMKNEEGKLKLSSMYGVFADKTANDMFNEGWCQSCDYDLAKCMSNNECKGYCIHEKSV